MTILNNKFMTKMFLKILFINALKITNYLKTSKYGKILPKTIKSTFDF